MLDPHLFASEQLYLVVPLDASTIYQFFDVLLIPLLVFYKFLAGGVDKLLQTKKAARSNAGQLQIKITDDPADPRIPALPFPRAGQSAAPRC